MKRPAPPEQGDATVMFGSGYRFMPGWIVGFGVFAATLILSVLKPGTPVLWSLVAAIIAGWRPPGCEVAVGYRWSTTDSSFVDGCDGSSSPRRLSRCQSRRLPPDEG